MHIWLISGIFEFVFASFLPSDFWLPNQIYYMFCNPKYFTCPLFVLATQRVYQLTKLTQNNFPISSRIHFCLNISVTLGCCFKSGFACSNIREQPLSICQAVYKMLTHDTVIEQYCYFTMLTFYHVKGHWQQKISTFHIKVFDLNRQIIAVWGWKNVRNVY